MREMVTDLLKIISDERVCGYWFGTNVGVIGRVIKPAISGKIPLTRSGSGGISTIASG